jgi:hypothetical protein
MFRIGGSAGEGITSGLAPRQGYNLAGLVKPLDFPGSDAEWQARLQKLKELGIIDAQGNRVGGPIKNIDTGSTSSTSSTSSTGSTIGDDTGTQNIIDKVTERKSILDAMYPRQKTDSMAGPNFLMNWGIDLASRPRSGNIFQQAATSAKNPLLQFQQEKLMEQAAGRKETSEDRALLAKMLEGMDDDKLSALMKDANAAVESGLYTGPDAKNQAIRDLLKKKIYGVQDMPGEAENARIRELELMISRDQEVPAGAIRAVAEHIYKIETGAYSEDIQPDLNRTKTYIKPNHIVGRKKDADGNIIELIIDGKYTRTYTKGQIYFDPGTGELFSNQGKEGEAPRFVLVVPEKK